MDGIDWSKIKVLTFDCYGTLVDWETGILRGLGSLLASRQVDIPDSTLLELYAELEGKAERRSFQNYKSVLREVMAGLAQQLNIGLNGQEQETLVESVKTWQPFPDTVDALQSLKSNFKLGIISNVDDDLFSFTERSLGVKFDWVITAEQVRSYKPSLNNFTEAFKKIGVPREQLLHVAQSLYHDIVPANHLGLHSVWVNKRHDKQGFGATLPAEAKPDAVVHDLHALVGLTGISQ